MLTTVARGRQRSHTPAAPTPVVPAPSPLPVPAVEPAVRPYWGDRVVLVLWLACAALLVGLHVGQHVAYLLR